MTKYKEIKEELAKTHTCLVAVSKTKPAAMIQEMYNAGQRIFGENRVQELTEKQEILPKDIKWHAIGHLQRNKVKYIAPFISMIHSGDSARLLTEIDKRAKENERVIDCLLQFHIAEEESKFGWQNLEEVGAYLQSQEYEKLNNIRICGVMGMATFTDNTEQVRLEFRRLEGYFNSLKSTFFAKDLSFKEISMGMSGDYQIAIEEGSTMVRIGSLLFGAR